jgi:hypothetical protein
MVPGDRIRLVKPIPGFVLGDRGTIIDMPEMGATGWPKTAYRIKFDGHRGSCNIGGHYVELLSALDEIADAAKPKE